MALALAKHCGAYLERFKALDVIYARTSDTALSLAERTKKANGQKVDLFLSFHVNSFTTATANGFESYHYHTNAKKLQQAVHEAVWSVYKAHGVKTNRGMKHGSFHVLRESKMPAVLTENLFISHPEVLKFNDPTFLQQVGEAHALGVIHYLGLTSATKHIVKKGETLWQISKKHGVSVSELVKANGIKNPDSIQVGTVLSIPQFFHQEVT